jgi:hypothetical protein
MHRLPTQQNDMTQWPIWAASLNGAPDCGAATTAKRQQNHLAADSDFVACSAQPPHCLSRNNAMILSSNDRI